MQTFLPNLSFRESAEVLDQQRLGKQRVEAWQILRINRGDDKGSRWSTHPAVKMWVGYDLALALYGCAMCSEWAKRGFKDNLRSYFDEVVREKLDAVLNSDNRTKSFLPDWLFDKRLVESHRSNLIRKKPEHYKKLWPDVPINLPYWWPTNG